MPWSGPVEPISEEDWFIKSNEFRLWLREERGKNLFEMETVRSSKPQLQCLMLLGPGPQALTPSGLLA